jgi:hypothetical protein
MDFYYSDDNFDRVRLSDGNLLGSACIFCRQFVAFGEDDEQLRRAERAHTCLKMARSAA